jgi:chitinase
MKSFLHAVSAIVLLAALSACSSVETTQSPPDAKQHSPKIIAYYMGNGSDLDRYNASQLTHIIYSFLYLDGNQLSFDSAEDQQTLQRLVALKQQNPQLKVMVALGGWGGCKTCSDVFNSAENRKAFALSTRALLEKYHADGIDLDWEYPTVPGYPGHKYAPYDRANFTALIEELRNAFGNRYELSFAAGGFDKFLETAVDWDAIMPLLDNVNLMNYDLVNGFSTYTGHHAALYSTPQQKDSTDKAVQFLLRKGVAPEKIVIGAAFYARVWEQVKATNNGLYQPGVHVEGAHYKDFSTRFNPADGYIYYWDDIAKAPSAYNQNKKIFATFDDKRSLAEKSRYIHKHQLGGMMFWQLPHDTDSDGLLDAIHKNLTSTVK